MMYRNLILFIIGILIIAACGNSNEKRNSKGQQYKSEEVKLNYFPAVEAPAVVANEDERHIYRIKNYWNLFLEDKRVEQVLINRDKLPKGSVLGLDSLVFEQRFGEYAQYINLYAVLFSYQEASEYLKELIKRADEIAVQGDKSLYFRLLELFEKYLYSPASPLLNEELYIPVMEAFMSSSTLDSLEKLPYKFQLDLASLNRVGTEANNFNFRELIKGEGGEVSYRKSSLYAESATFTLLFFNNPDCPACSEILAELKSSSQIMDRVDTGELKIITVYVDEDLDLWRNNRDSYPDNWLYTHTPDSNMADNKVYGLRAIPSLYLLDKDKKVIFKDAPSGSFIINYFTPQNFE